MSNFNKFYQKSIKDRIDILSKNGLYEEKFDVSLSVDDVNRLSENVITTFELPLGVVPNFKVDNINYVVPMVTEEPSVIAALSNAAKITNELGFVTKVHSRLMIGQIFFMPNQNNIESILETNKENIFKIANDSHKSIFNRGGGLKEFELKTYNKDNSSYSVLYLTIDVKEAMGANIINTILEAIKDYLSSLGLLVLMAILSNLATKSLVTSSVKINIDTLKGTFDTANKIVLANTYASLDIHRATTHNKGIANGISAFFLATGNDTRALESSIHAYASIDNYSALTTWEVESNYLVGKITIPCAIGSVGSIQNILSKAKLSLGILNNPNSQTLMSISASIGLAQNFAALYALTTDGIQKGHMNLHNRLK